MTSIVKTVYADRKDTADVDKKCFNDGIKMKFVVEFKNLNAVLDD